MLIFNRISFLHLHRSYRMWSEGPRHPLLNPEGNGAVQLLSEALQAPSVSAEREGPALSVFWDRTCLNDCARLLSEGLFI